jgi:hypothetical protein
VQASQAGAGEQTEEQSLSVETEARTITLNKKLRADIAVNLRPARANQAYSSTEPQCQYRFCGEMLSDSKVKNGAKYCSDSHRVLEYRERTKEMQAKKKAACDAALQAAAERFRKENPEVLWWLIHELQEKEKAGWEYYSIYKAWEDYRYSQPPYPIHLDNRYRKFYVKWVLDAAPELAGFLRVRG